MSLGDVNLACAWALVEELVRGGMVHACVSPGSRSTPLALALERHPAITTHVHLDERSSAFFALGIAKATGRPVGVACTSGTAAAELFPAVVEASQARVPLVLLTADRPPRLRGTGANQTIDQVELYGRYARAWLEPPVPSSLGDASRWAEAGRAAIEAARGSPAGPVQVNCPFEEPLVPEGKWKPQVEASAPGPIGGTGAAFPEISLPDVIGALTSSDHGLVVVGSIPRASAGVLEVAERLGWPVLAEPTSNLRLPGRALAAGQALVSSAPWMDTMAPEVVVQLGAAPTTRATQALVSRADRLVVVDDHHPEPDPEGRATARVRLGPIFFANAVLRELPPPPPAASEWQAAWLAADARARAAVDRLLDRWDEPYEGRIARDLAAAIPDGGTLVVGSSMPIRDLDHYMSPREGLRVLANRGASGIDGVVSTALGVAAASAAAAGAAAGGGPTFALIGDLTLLHDVGALLWNARRGLDAVLVVLGNGGGTIFGFLPQRDLPEHRELFVTPHGFEDFSALCATAGAGHTRVERSDELVPALDRAAASGGVTVVEVIVDPELNRARHGQVQAAVDAALQGLS